MGEDAIEPMALAPEGSVSSFREHRVRSLHENRSPEGRLKIALTRHLDPT